MYLPPALVQIAHEQKLKDLGLVKSEQASKGIGKWQEPVLQIEYPYKKKRSKIIQHFFSWNRLIDLYHSLKATVLQWIQRNHDEESCELSILSCTQNTVDCGDI